MVQEATAFPFIDTHRMTGTKMFSEQGGCGSSHCKMVWGVASASLPVDNANDVAARCSGKESVDTECVL